DDGVPGLVQMPVLSEKVRLARLDDDGIASLGEDAGQRSGPLRTPRPRRRNTEALAQGQGRLLVEHGLDGLAWGDGNAHPRGKPLAMRRDELDGALGGGKEDRILPRDEEGLQALEEPGGVQGGRREVEALLHIARVKGEVELALEAADPDGDAAAPEGAHDAQVRVRGRIGDQHGARVRHRGPPPFPAPATRAPTKRSATLEVT